MQPNIVKPRILSIISSPPELLPHHMLVPIPETMFPLNYPPSSIHHPAQLPHNDNVAINLHYMGITGGGGSMTMMRRRRRRMMLWRQMENEAYKTRTRVWWWYWQVCSASENRGISCPLSHNNRPPASCAIRLLAIILMVIIIIAIIIIISISRITIINIDSIYPELNYMQIFNRWRMEQELLQRFVVSGSWTERLHNNNFQNIKGVCIIHSNGLIIRRVYCSFVK